ncbi:MAG TPA: transporter [Methylocystis sp.]|nr:transporter [Methylocystis sp.]
MARPPAPCYLRKPMESWTPIPKAAIYPGFALSLFLGLAGPALAQSADDASYVASAPASDSGLRDLCTDRPPKANLPCTVDAGHFQYESDVFNWTRAVSGGATTDTFLYSNPTLKAGVTSTLDLEANMAPFERVVTRSASGRQTFAGVGDLYLRSKLNLAGPDGGDAQAAVIPYLKAPTGSPGISNRAVEGGVIAPFSFALPQGFTLLFDPEIDVLRNANDFRRHANIQFLGNLSHALTDSVTGYVELWGQANADPASPSKQASLDLSLAWLAWKKSPSLQFDVGANIGLTSATPRLQLYLGVSQKF